MTNLRRPFVDHVGIRIEEYRDGLGRSTMPIQAHHFNSAGIVHGGALFTLADTTMGAALYSTLGPDEGCATIEIKINFFKPVTGGSVTCTAGIVSKGRTVANLEASLYVGEVLVANTNGTFAIFKRREEPSRP